MSQNQDWKLEAEDRVLVKGPNGLVMDCGEYDGNGAKNFEAAEFVVLACNSHAEMLTALEAVVDLAKTLSKYDPATAMKMARVAISNARKPKGDPR